MRALCRAAVAASLAMVACGGDDGGIEALDGYDSLAADTETRVDTKLPPLDVTPMDTTATPDTATGDTGGTVDTAAGDTGEADTQGGCDGFECPCNSNGDCLDELCVEGPDGRICTRTCVAECPDGYDCVSSSAFGPDPIFLCLPQHARVCRPCMGDTDCQDPSDPFPAYCLPAPDPAQGSFCGSSCAGRDCPEGYSCESVTLGSGGVAKQCVPQGGVQCTCRPSWDGLGFATRCDIANGFGTCEGTRTCGAFGLTPCDGPQATQEICNSVDDDCNGVTDDIPATACQVQNQYGTCPGTLGCSDLGPVCEGTPPAAEACNGVDDNCDGVTDDAGCDDGLACTDDNCAGAFDCRHTLKAGFCQIDGACWTNGGFNPNNACQVCNTAVSTSQWSQAGNTCLINSVCYPNGAVNPNNACQLCDVNQSGTSWSVAGNTCTIGGACYASGAANPDNPCQICTPSQSTTMWTQAASTCNIQGQCFASGVTKPGSPCLICSPEQNATGWTARPSTASCDDGSPCSTDDHCDGAGSCVGDTSCNDGVACTADVCTGSGCDHSGVPSGWCRIGGTCYTNNTSNPSNACQRCNPGSNQTSWSPQPSTTPCEDGSACTTGDHCSGTGSCVSGSGCGDGLSCTTDVCNPATGCSYPTASGKCKINDACYSNGDTRPGNVCYRCNASSSQSSWSYNNGVGCNDGDECTKDDTCSNGGCSGTDIGDNYEPNESSTAPYNFGNFSDNSEYPQKTVAPTAYPSGDVDWYRFQVSDDGGNIEPRVRLTNLPAGHSYQLCIYFRCTDDDEAPSNLECGAAGGASVADATYQSKPYKGCCTNNNGMYFEWSLIGDSEFECDGTDDSFRALVSVRRTSGTPHCSKTYTLEAIDD